MKKSELDLIKKHLDVKDDDLTKRAEEAFKKGKIDDDFLDRIKKVYRGKIDPADLEKAGKAHED